MNDKKYAMTTPCDLCPFRRTGGVSLRRARVTEIERSLVLAEFPCHKTVNYETRDESKEVHCAGALILLEKLERPSQMMRIGERIGMYDARKLDMDADVFDDFDEMREAQKLTRRVTPTTERAAGRR